MSTKVRKAPVEDLLKYFDEIYLEEELPNAKNFKTFIERYYKNLTDYDISLPNNLIMPVWCDNNYCKDLEKLQTTAGILLYRNLNGREEFGLTFLGPQTPRAKTMQKTIMWCWRTDRKGDLCREPFCEYDWDAWGHMDAYFTYPRNEIKEIVPFGIKEIKLHDSGFQVMLLQQMLNKFDNTTEINGYFDEKTEEAVKTIQNAFSIEPTGIMSPENIVKLSKLIYGGE